MIRTKTIFFGTPEYAIPILEALKQAGYEIVAVITQPPKPVGRKLTITPSPAAVWAAANHIPVIDTPPKESVKKIKSYNADMGILEAYGRILPPDILSTFPKGIVNVHPSLLPKYRGPSPIQEAILAGDTETGVTLILLDEQVDHGPTIASKKIPIAPDDTLESLRHHLFSEAAELLVQTLPQYLKGQLSPTPQDDSQATFTKIIKKEDGYFDINNPPAPEKLDKMVRAYHPWPSVWTRFNNKIIKLLPNKKIQMEGKRPATIQQFKTAYPEVNLN